MVQRLPDRVRARSSQRVGIGEARGDEPAKRERGESNIQWLTRNMPTMPAVEDAARVLLVGGMNALALRLRVALSHVRHDLTPSPWSHMALLDQTTDPLPGTKLLEVSLEPPDGFGFPPPDNSIQALQW